MVLSSGLGTPHSDRAHTHKNKFDVVLKSISFKLVLE